MAYDPIGPGTIAWNAFDDYIEARIRRHRMNQHAARQRMIYQVTKHGGDYKAWLKLVQERVKEFRDKGAVPYPFT